MTDIGAERALISARRERVKMALAVQAEFKEVAETGARLPWAIWRCDLPHSGGSPKLAEAILVGRRALFASRIAWLPSDMLTLRPWQRDRLLGATRDASGSGISADDAVLQRFVDDLNDWMVGREPTGERWLVRAPAFEVFTVLMPDDEGVGPIGTWVRCKNHPQDQQQISKEHVFGALRRVRTPMR